MDHHSGPIDIQTQTLQNVRGSVPSGADTEPLLVGVVGAANAGKDTLADAIVDEHPSKFMNVSLSTAIKNVGMEYFGMQTWHCFTSDGKEENHPYLTHEDGTPMKNRHVLEIIGDKLQEIDPLVLIRAAKQRIQGTPQAVFFTDLRTEPQAQFIRDEGGIIVYVQRDDAEKVAESADKENHHTKTFYKRTEPDFVIENNGSLENFRATVKNLFLRRMNAFFPKVTFSS
jgi:hypothetical protein